MAYQRSFIVQAPLERVREFHRSAESLKAITPPVFFMSRLSAPKQLAEGDEMAFTLWMGPLPVRWEARIENMRETGFNDVQVRGPFAAWVHSHRFEPLDASTTRVHDHVSYRLRRHPFWGPLGLFMAFGLPLLFRYRAYRTRTLLERTG